MNVGTGHDFYEHPNVAGVFLCRHCSAHRGSPKGSRDCTKQPAIILPAEKIAAKSLPVPKKRGRK